MPGAGCGGLPRTRRTRPGMRPGTQDNEPDLPGAAGWLSLPARGAPALP